MKVHEGVKILLMHETSDDGDETHIMVNSK